jgi:adenosylcobinamide-GDP ribazoletransferase
MKALLAAMRFLTVVPIPGTWGTAEADLGRSVPWFPVVGLMLGGVAAVAAWMLARAAPPMVAAVLVVLLLAGFSGCLHLDGLSDTADGLLSSRPRGQMLQIMHDSHAGAMGIIALVFALLAKFAALASLPAAMLAPVVLLMPLAGRSAMVVHMALLPYARESGLGSVFYRKSAGPAAVGAWGLLAATAWLVLGLPGLAIGAACLLVSVALAVYFRHKIGGATGDTFGAVCEIVETVPPLTLAVWSFHTR